MTIETLDLLQKQKRKDAQRMPCSSVSIEQASMVLLNEAVILLTEICIELKQARMHE